MNDYKITIIEGPPPIFEMVYDDWAVGLAESPNLGDVAITRLRTFDGPKMVDRCHEAWENKEPILLEYRTLEGLTQEVPILASRAIDTKDGDVLLLWVRLPNGDITLELDYGDEDDLDFPDFDL